MFKRKQKLCRNGVAAVEFAFVAPIFFLLVFAIIELGRMMMVQQSLTNAAREGCRKAVLATTTNGSDVEDAVRDYLQSVMSNASDSGSVRVTVPSSMSTATSGSSLTVAVEVDYSDVTWLPLGYLGLNPTIRARQIGLRE
ncbi:MAG TPA: TadE/TadG family type IV pilus assembly protein [Lacipirellulaceae bacterium]|jgi:Flp pilus assembly protein TadG|nr:TadE/TadG family type IV pilus assembly protein [Lacipirellulaceae bacterium]